VKRLFFVGAVIWFVVLVAPFVTSSLSGQSSAPRIDGEACGLCRVYGLQLAVRADGTFTVPKGLGLVVFRNGVRMTVNLDYTISSSVLIPSETWSASDLVVVDYTP
jgi:hypothetical protein